MQNPRDKQGISSGQMRFPTTQWTAIEDIRQRETLKEELYAQYWNPLYHFCRRNGISSEDAQDFVQGFLTEILLGREFISKADRTRGRFRSLLLISFKNYIGMIRRKNRIPLSSNNDISECDVPETVPQDPVAAFDYTWAISILDRALVDLETECKRDGLEVHWAIFKEKVLDPILNNTPVPSLKELCKKYSVAKNGQASSMIVTVKRRFGKILNRYLAETGDPEGIPEEALNDFINIFSHD
ncbi:RNA polymerase sigma factor [Planctomycetota bacterium]